MLGLLAPAAAPSAAAGQTEAVIEQLAPLLAAEDARDWREELFRRGLASPEPLVRRTAALAVGRIGDSRGTPLLAPLLADPDSTVRPVAAFALGLTADTAALPPLAERLTGLPPLDVATAVEAVTALARVAGPRAGELFGALLEGRVPLPQEDRAPVVGQLVLEAWRLGADAPVRALLPFLDDTAAALRWRAAYALGRLRAPAAAERLTVALRDGDPAVRAAAARALTRAYADTARLAPATIAGALARAADDENPGVRANALRSLGTFGDSAFAPAAAARLADPDPNVQVQAAITLGQLGGAAAAEALARAFRGRGSWALHREALVGLGDADPRAFAAAAPAWAGSADWRERAAAAEGWAAAGAAGQPRFAADRDGRVIAAGLQAWMARADSAAPAVVAAARRLLGHPDGGVRSAAADIAAEAAEAADLPALAASFRRAGRDSFPDAALSVLHAVDAIRNRSPAGAARASSDFLEAVPRPEDHLLLRWAEEHWPEAAARWGPAYPVTTGRTLDDYRAVARAYLTAPDSLARPRVAVETAGHGTIEVELLGPEAPLTVANFLRLVDRRFFDNLRWHRVVPNFVVQTGDPRGDGYGGPGGAIRDEINRVRYDRPVLGMALSGPDTGSSQWFINLSSQPHLDGTYTVFGRVVGGSVALGRVTQGEAIRTVRRQ
jgi:cyclophilin family peptidyl-prolyl cis-trans isomerase/HEAT repeat protein